MDRSIAMTILSRFFQLLWLFTILSVSSYCLALTETTKVSNLLIFGDSLSDSDGDYSTWKLLNTLAGEPMIDLHAFYEDFLEQSIPGYKALKTLPVVGTTMARHEQRGIDSFLSVSSRLPIPLLPDPSVYVPGKFTGGKRYRKVWTEYLAEMMSVPESRFDNRAMAGSSVLCTHGKIASLDTLLELSLRPKELAINFFSGSMVPPCEQMVVRAWLREKHWVDGAQTLVVFFSGFNDYLNRWSNPQIVVKEYVSDIRRMLESGTRYLAVINVPDVTCAPRFIQESSDIRTEVKDHILTHNDLLVNELKILAKEYPDAKIVPVDARVILDELLVDARNTGIITDHACTSVAVAGIAEELSNSVTSLVDLICEKPEFSDAVAVKDALDQAPGDLPCCKNPDDYFFFDSIHPGARTHSRMAQHVCRTLLEAGIQCKPDHFLP